MQLSVHVFVSRTRRRKTATQGTRAIYPRRGEVTLLTVLTPTPRKIPKAARGEWCDPEDDNSAAFVSFLRGGNVSAPSRQSQVTGGLEPAVKNVDSVTQGKPRPLALARSVCGPSRPSPATSPRSGRSGSPREPTVAARLNGRIDTAVSQPHGRLAGRLLALRRHQSRQRRIRLALDGR